ncbi:MAG: TIGR00269 family protein [Candidatus Micrarchaeota archaeon]|nr:TIGR00269 family protein [Candidatus Micrarchaeota archaeon]
MKNFHKNFSAVEIRRSSTTMKNKCGKCKEGKTKARVQTMGSGKCSKCNKASVIALRYAGIEFCQSHFTRFFEARVMRTVREFSMLARKDRIAVALSGGKDSTVMLHLLKKIGESFPMELFAITIDEGIAGYREFSLKTAVEECKKLGVPLTVVSFRSEFGQTLDSLLKKRGEARACSYCGVMRRYLLNKVARRMGADKIAIGHNSDDVAQTVMMNYMRNEPERLARFGPVAGAAEDELFVTRIKPLFLTPEREVAAYAMMKGIEIKNIGCPYAKSAFRQHVRKILNETEEKYPASKLRIVRAFLAQKKLMQEGAKKRIEKHGKPARCKECGEPSSNREERCALCLLLSEK